MKGIEYIIACTCGRGIKLGLTPREQRDRDLNPSTAQFVNLFDHFHKEHGKVIKWFSDEPMPDRGAAGADAEREEK